MKIIWFILLCIEWKTWKLFEFIDDNRQNNSYYVYINDFNRFMCNKTKNKNKKHFCKYCLQWFSSERVLVEHKETLKINVKQTVKIRSGWKKFRNHFKQLLVPFTIYADFEALLKEVRGSDKKIILHALKNIRKTFLAVLLIKVSVLMINLVKQLVFIEEKVQSIDLLKQFWTRMIIGKSDKKAF